jgi:molecular chaperone DnaK
VHEVEKAMKEHGSKVGETERSAIEAAMVAVKDALKGEDPDFIKSKTEALLQASLKLGEAMYKGANPDAGAAGGDPTGGGADPGAAAAGGATDGGDVVDADYEEVDEEKKKKGGAR